MKMAELGEFGFIDRIRAGVARSAETAGVVRGIGDDCAVLELPPDHLLLTTTDMLVEDIHFRREWTDFANLGRKSVSVNVSDVAAMGGTPHHLYLGLAFPGTLPLEQLDAFVAGFLDACRFYQTTLVGGDTCSSSGPIAISVTVEGSVPKGRFVPRDGARPGDAIYVSGTLGDSALALHLLQEGKPVAPFLLERHINPQARTRLGPLLSAAGIPSAMIDVSDGPVSDLGHILERSGSVDALVDEEALPLSEPFRALLQTDRKLLRLALGGGEDYELLFTVPPEREHLIPEVAQKSGLALSRIGVISSGSGILTVRSANGEEYRPARKGFDHFAG
ncbi:MAG: thiamine-phosphate kinase [Deltaproteobacteria bacterium]|nr:thiamine-phosphate kinase [Deltaproteobacteria bacterium]